VRIYSCGPTVYRYVHVGNLRTFMLPDLLRRSLEYLGYANEQVMNITDVGHLTDDTFDRGEDRYWSPRASKASRRRRSPALHSRIQEDAAKLNIRPPAHYPSTQYVPGYRAHRKVDRARPCYEVGGTVYFDIASFPATASCPKQHRQAACRRAQRGRPAKAPTGRLHALGPAGEHRLQSGRAHGNGSSFFA